METEMVPMTRNPKYPYSVQLDEDRARQMEEMKAGGESATEVLKRGFDREYRAWKRGRSA